MKHILFCIQYILINRHTHCVLCCICCGLDSQFYHTLKCYWTVRVITQISSRRHSVNPMNIDMCMNVLRLLVRPTKSQDIIVVNCPTCGEFTSPPSRLELKATTKYLLCYSHHHPNPQPPPGHFQNGRHNLFFSLFWEGGGGRDGGVGGGDGGVGGGGWVGWVDRGETKHLHFP